MRLIIVIAVMVGLTTGAFAGEPDKFTIEQCISILSGLNSLSYAGQPLTPVNENAKPPADAKQYKLGPTRMTVGLDINALTPIWTEAQRSQQAFARELPPLPPSDPKNPNSAAERDDAAAALNKKLQANWDAQMKKPCPVQPAHIKASELKIGDGQDENQIPVTVLGNLAPILDH